MPRNDFGMGLNKGGNNCVAINIKDFAWAFCSRFNFKKSEMWKWLKVLKYFGLIRDYNFRCVYLSQDVYKLLFRGGENGRKD